LFRKGHRRTAELLAGSSPQSFRQFFFLSY